MHLSRHFTLDELSFSQTARAHGIDNRPGPAELEALRALCTAVLDPLRDAIGRPIKVNSGYRGPALNQRIGGARKSQHLVGEAADLQAPGLPVIELFKTAIRLRLPYDQIIYEANGSAKWVHLSHRAGGNRGQILVAEFGPDGKPRAYPARTVEQALAMSEPASRSIDGEDPDYIETADEPPHLVPQAPAEAAPAVARQAARKKTAAKKTAAKKPAAKKTAAKKTPAKEAAAKQVAAKPAPTKKAPAKTATASRQTAARKTAAKPVAGRKAAASQAPVTKPTARPPVAKRSAATTPPTRRAATGKPASVKSAAGKPAARRARG